MKENRLAYIALAFVCIVWGTTYVALLIGVRHFPPFLFTAFRQISAGVLMTGFMLLAKQQKLGGWANIWRQAVVGTLMICIGNGLVGWAEMYVPAGIAALIGSLSPLWVVLINLAVNRTEKPNAIVWVGILVGVFGMVVLFRDNLALLADPNYAMGIILIFLAVLGWAGGSVFIKKQKVRSHPVLNAGLQLFFGGLGCWILSIFFDDWSGAIWSPQMMWPLLYLIFLGSLAAYAAYGYALSKLPVTVVSLHAYINPLVAVFLGWFMLGEKLNVMIGLAFICIATSIWLVNKGFKMKNKPQPLGSVAGGPRLAGFLRAPKSKAD